VHRCLEDRHARSLGAGEGSGDVESLLRKQVVEVVSGDSPGDVRIALADEVAVTVA
jgi:hypothetical protein